LIFEVFEKKEGMEYIIFSMTEQKTRFKKFGNISIGYRSMNG